MNEARNPTFLFFQCQMAKQPDEQAATRTTAVRGHLSFEAPGVRILAEGPWNRAIERLQRLRQRGRVPWTIGVALIGASIGMIPTVVSEWPGRDPLWIAILLFVIGLAAVFIGHDRASQNAFTASEIADDLIAAASDYGEVTTETFSRSDVE